MFSRTSREITFSGPADYEFWLFNLFIILIWVFCTVKFLVDEVSVSFLLVMCVILLRYSINRSKIGYVTTTQKIVKQNPNTKVNIFFNRTSE